MKKIIWEGTEHWELLRKSGYHEIISLSDYKKALEQLKKLIFFFPSSQLYFRLKKRESLPGLKGSQFETRYFYTYLISIH
jgi:hypothetical protein